MTLLLGGAGLGAAVFFDDIGALLGALAVLSGLYAFGRMPRRRGLDPGEVPAADDEPSGWRALLRVRRRRG